MKWISHIPLIGGFTIAGINELGCLPEAITSYQPFYANDSLLLRYINDVLKTNIPYYQLDIIGKTFNDIDIVVGVPPCAGLSTASSLNHEQRLSCTVNDWMIKSIKYILEHISPKVYVFENAPGLYSNSGSFMRDKINDLANNFNYSVVYYKTVSLNHGLPQDRIRTYCFLVKSKTAPILNKYKTEYPDLATYLNKIPKTASLQQEFYSDNYNIEEFEIYKYLFKLYGDNWRKEVIKDNQYIASYNYLLKNNLLEDFLSFLESQPNKNEKLIKNVKHILYKLSIGKNFRIGNQVLLLFNKYTNTIISERFGMCIHPIYNRTFNIREYMHMMGLPHDFELYNKKEYGKIAQNCPVATNMDMLKECKAIINGEREYSNEKILFIDNSKK